MKTHHDWLPAATVTQLKNTIWALPYLAVMGMIWGYLAAAAIGLIIGLLMAAVTSVIIGSASKSRSDRSQTATAGPQDTSP